MDVVFLFANKLREEEIVSISKLQVTDIEQMVIHTLRVKVKHLT